MRMPSVPGKRRLKSTHRNSSQFPFMKEPSPGFFPSKQELLQLFRIIAIASLVALACNYSANLLNRPPKPFCSDGLPADPPSEFCEPCPKNAKCYNSKWECLHGYKKQGKACVEDGEINQRAKVMSDRIEQRVCEKYAQFLCDGSGQTWFQEAELFKEFDAINLKENDGSQIEIHNYAVQKAVETVRKSLEKRKIIDGITELKCPDRLVESYKPLLCRFRLWVYGNAVIILSISIVLTGILRYTWRIRQHQSLISRAEDIYEQVCEILEEKAVMARSSSDGEPWVVASRLRDHLLLPKERKKTILWKKVEELVQEDSRVDQYPKLVKGEQKIVWEWQVEGSLSSRLKLNRASDNTKISHSIHDSSSTLQQKVQMGQIQ